MTTSKCKKNPNHKRKHNDKIKAVIVAFIKRTGLTRGYSMYNATDVANFIISENKVDNLTPLKLQKLLYFIYGIYWKQNKKDLFKDKFLAWDYGPVIEDLYHLYKGYKSNPITQPTNDRYLNAIPDEDKVKILKIAEEIGKLKATELVSMSHLTPPWQEAYKDILNNEISSGGIKRYFENLVVA